MATQSDQVQIDPVCGKTVNQDVAELGAQFSEYKGRTYYFCSRECREDFQNAPQYFAGHTPGPPEYEGPVDWQP